MKSAALAILSLLAVGQDGEEARLLARYRECRPSDDSLRFYRLDWAADLAAAKARAAKERRPVFFIAVTNISGPDTFFTGHC